MATLFGMTYRIEGMFLRSKVARRVFLLFMLSAFVPVALLTALSYSQLRNLNQDYVRKQLQGEASNYARGLYERLLGAHLLLGTRVPSQRNAGRATDDDRRDVQKVFRITKLMRGAPLADLAAASDAGMPTPVRAALYAHLKRGESAMLLARRDDRSVVVTLVRALDPDHPDKGVVAGELDPDYLWGAADEFSDQTQTCVRDAAGKALFCSGVPHAGSEDAAALRAPAPQDTEQNPWPMHQRALFLRARFGAEDWTIVTQRPPGMEDAMRGQLAYTSAGVILLTLLLVAFLSVVQIRRTLVPIERLLEATKRIGRQDFRRPVKIDRQDEFGELAVALNKMATQLGMQITTLRALSEIDQEILSRVDMAEIISRVQERLQDLWPDAVTGMVVFDKMAADFGIVHLYSGKEGVTAKLPTKLEPWLMERLARDYDGLWFDVGATELPDFLTMMVNSGAIRILVLPIYWREKVNGLLAIGLKQAQDFSEHQIQRARDLGNRIGVAMAAHARDEELKFRAYHDSLTGLPNRPLLLEHLNQEMAHARRTGKRLAVIFMDLDRFKNINDSMGHDVGDRLLCQVAERLTSCVREGDTVARLGGDEFVVLLPGLGDPQQAARWAAEMMSLVREPFLLDHGESYIGVSIGVSIFPEDGGLGTELLKKADMAMYRAKATGRGRIVFFEEGMNIAQQERAALERELRQALAREQFTLQFQPRFRLQDQQLCGVEALLQWRHPERGWLPSELFLPLAEEIGLMDDIGPWMMRQACEQLVRWQTAGYPIDAVTVAVTPGQLKTGHLVALVEEIRHETGIRPRALELELSEDGLGEQIEDVADQLEELKRMGVAIVLNNFGTGYASLSNLQRLPIDVLKIAPEFVRELGRHTEATSIVYSILTLAHALGKTVMAQGVEQPQQCELLRSWGCEQAQGTYFGRPLTPQELEEMWNPSRPAEIS